MLRFELYRNRNRRKCDCTLACSIGQIGDQVKHILENRRSREAHFWNVQTKSFLIVLSSSYCGRQS